MACVALLAWMRLNAAGPSLNPGESAAPETAALDAARYASMVIPTFEMTDQHGAVHTREIFKDRYTILAFSFTNCPAACPVMHSHLLRLQEELHGTPVRIVTISVDPAHDTPAAMKAYLEKITADQSRWTFLTGSTETVAGIVKSMQFALIDDPSLVVTLPDGSTMNNISHPTKLMLIGPDATVIAMDDGLAWAGAQRLAVAARRAAAHQ